MGTAIYTGVTGLIAHQRRLDVIASNIANVNTVGYRGSRCLFQDLFSQTVEGGRAPVGNFGGSNPVQIGLGVRIASIDVNYSQGSLITTGVSSDLAIQGSGFFVLNDGLANYFSRDGSFTLNADGELVEPSTGMRVQGYLADSTGMIDPNQVVSDVVIPVGGAAIVRATENVSLVGNLDSDAAAGDTVVRTVRVYDSLGTPRDIEVTYTKRAQVTVDGGATLYNAWDWEAEYTNIDGATNTVGSGTLAFDPVDGSVFSEGTLAGSDVTTRPPGAPEISVALADFGTLDSFPETPFEFEIDWSDITELSADSDVTVSNQDGFPRGTLESFNIGRDGTINGVFTNGLTRVLGQVALGVFANVGGLERRGSNMFRGTPASGTAQIGLPDSGGRGQVSGGVLEGSNVDLGTEFSNMIVTQRGFQANARTITTADTVLQEAVNLVR